MAASTPPRDASQLTELALLSEHYWTDRRALLPVLGAYLPRFGDGSPLSALPKEVLQHIARLAYRPRLKPKFEIPGDNVLLREYVEKFGREPTVNLHDEHYLLNGGHKQCHPYGVDSARKLEFDFPEDFQYIELSFYRWCGTRLAIGDWELEFTVFDHGESHIVELSRADSDVDFWYGHVKAWDGVWKNDGSRDDELVALLFDPTGAVHVAVNGVAALSLPLPQWDAIKIKLWDTDLYTDPNLVPSHPDIADTVTFPASVPKPIAALPGLYPMDFGFTFDHALCDECDFCRDDLSRGIFTVN
jgi:hypothetical protein